MVGAVRVGNGDGDRCGSDVADQHLRGLHAGGQLVDSHIVKVGRAAVVVTEGQTAGGNAGEGDFMVSPTVAVGQTGGNRREGGDVGDIGDDTNIETMTIGRQHVELETQQVGSGLKRGQHQYRGGRRTAAHIEALASTDVDRRRVVDIRVGCAVGIDKVPAEDMVREEGSRSGIGRARTGLEVLNPGQVGIGNGETGRAERGIARRGLRAVQAVGKHLHRIAGVVRKVSVGNGLSENNAAVHQRVTGVKHHSVVVNIVSVGDVHRSGVGRDSRHADSLRLGAGGAGVGVGGCGGGGQREPTARADFHQVSVSYRLVVVGVRGPRTIQRVAPPAIR